VKAPLCFRKGTRKEVGEGGKKKPGGKNEGGKESNFVGEGGWIEERKGAGIR